MAEIQTAILALSTRKDSDGNLPWLGLLPLNCVQGCQVWDCGDCPKGNAKACKTREPCQVGQGGCGQQEGEGNDLGPGLQVHCWQDHHVAHLSWGSWPPHVQENPETSLDPCHQEAGACKDSSKQNEEKTCQNCHCLLRRDPLFTQWDHVLWLRLVPGQGHRGSWWWHGPLLQEVALCSTAGPCHCGFWQRQMPSDLPQGQWEADGKDVHEVPEEAGLSLGQGNTRGTSCGGSRTEQVVTLPRQHSITWPLRRSTSSARRNGLHTPPTSHHSTSSYLGGWRGHSWESNTVR